MSTVLRLSLDEYDRIIEQGAFDEIRDKRIELIHGELREMPPAGPDHEDAIDRLNRWSNSKTSAELVRIRIQNSIGIPPSVSAPEPDVAWVTEKNYQTGRPLPDDVFLVIEVADSSVGDDRFIKGPLYAAAGIADYWIVNIPERCIEVHRDPAREGYRDVQSYGIDESVRPLAFPDLELSVAELFAG